MANPKDVLMKAQAAMSPTIEKDPAGMKELVSKVFTSRNSIHFAHLASKSYAQHEALGYLYTAIVNKMDSIIEAWQGKHGLLSGLSSEAASCPSDCCSHVKEEAKWIEENKERIAAGCDVIKNMVDELSAIYLSTIYKLENLS